MAILAVFHNFFGYYQNAEKPPFLQKFFVQYFVAYATHFRPPVYIIYIKSMSAPERQKDKKCLFVRRRNTAYLAF